MEWSTSLFGAAASSLRSASRRLPALTSTARIASLPRTAGSMSRNRRRRCWCAALASAALRRRRAAPGGTSRRAGGNPSSRTARAVSPSCSLGVSSSSRNGGTTSCSPWARQWRRRARRCASTLMISSLRRTRMRRAATGCRTPTPCCAAWSFRASTPRFRASAATAKAASPGSLPARPTARPRGPTTATATGRCSRS